MGDVHEIEHEPDQRALASGKPVHGRVTRVALDPDKAGI